MTDLVGELVSLRATAGAASPVQAGQVAVETAMGEPSLGEAVFASLVQAETLPNPQRITPQPPARTAPSMSIAAGATGPGLVTQLGGGAPVDTVPQQPGALPKQLVPVDAPQTVDAKVPLAPASLESGAPVNSTATESTPPVLAGIGPVRSKEQPQDKPKPAPAIPVLANAPLLSPPSALAPQEGTRAVLQASVPVLPLAPLNATQPLQELPTPPSPQRGMVPLQTEQPAPQPSLAKSPIPDGLPPLRTTPTQTVPLPDMPVERIAITPASPRPEAPAPAPSPAPAPPVSVIPPQVSTPQPLERPPAVSQPVAVSPVANPPAPTTQKPQPSASMAMPAQTASAVNVMPGEPLTAPIKPQATRVPDTERRERPVELRAALPQSPRGPTAPVAPPPVVQTSPPPMTTVQQPAFQFDLGAAASDIPLEADPRLGALQTEASPTFSRSAEVIMTRPEVMARSVPAQVAEAMRTANSASGTVEVQLHPEELGRVRVALSPGETGTQVMLTAERAETLDLLRRHIGLLEADLKQQGYSGLSFSFAQNSQGDWSEQPRGEEDHTSPADLGLMADDTVKAPMPPTRLSPHGQVDLRI